MLVGVTEDDPDLAFLLGAFLQEQGHEVVISTDGAEALAACRERPPTVLLLDVTLPGR